MIDFNPKTLKFIAECDTCGDVAEYESRDYAKKNSKKCLFCKKSHRDQKLRAAQCRWYQKNKKKLKARRNAAAKENNQ